MNKLGIVVNKGENIAINEKKPTTWKETEEYVNIQKLSGHPFYFFIELNVKRNENQIPADDTVVSFRICYRFDGI